MPLSHLPWCAALNPVFKMATVSLQYRVWESRWWNSNIYFKGDHQCFKRVSFFWEHATYSISGNLQGLTLNIWFTRPSGTWFWKLTCPENFFACPANICRSPVKLIYTAGKISPCPDWKITCPGGHVTTKLYVPWDKIYVPRACGHTLMSSPDLGTDTMTFLCVYWWQLCWGAWLVWLQL